MAQSLNDSFLCIGDAEIEYAFVGPGPDRAPTIVLLHEGLGSVSAWRDFPQCLQEATGMGVFAYSRAGYGLSSTVPLPRPLDYLRREAVSVLPEVLDAIGFRDGVLFGHSDGASIATIHAGAIRDSRVRGLALLAPHFFVESVSIEGIRQARAEYLEGGFRDRLARHHRDVDVAFRGWCDTWLNPDFAAFDLSDDLDRIAIPVLMVQGENDRYGTLAQLDMLRKRCPAPVDSLILPDCGHAPHRERTKETCERLILFMKQRLGMS